MPKNNHNKNLDENYSNSDVLYIANILGCDTTFPVWKQHHLLPQMELQPSNVPPKISVYSYLNGIYDYKNMPLALLVCRAQCFIGLEERTLFGTHSVNSWYIGMSTDHYRCHKVLPKKQIRYAPLTQSFSDTKDHNPCHHNGGCNCKCST